MGKNDVTIRIGTKDDIENVQLLNNRWLISNIEDKSHGFLVGEIFTFSDLEKIIDAKELAVAYSNDELIGYYLLDNHSETNISKLCQQKINELIEDGILNKTDRISCRAAAVIDRNFQGQGLSKELFKILLDENREKYNILFSIVLKQNPKIIAHQKIGWKIISEDKTRFYVIYKVEEIIK